ncbi:MAG: regulatory protein RecX [Acidobacteria bacterium]|nr:regulatory protein RecX [Acidobacteriota bacterium]
MSFSRRPKQSAPLDEAGLYERAVAALGRRMRTVAEIRKLLRLRAEPGEVGAAHIEAVLARLKDHGYLNDAAFAEDFTRLRQQNRSLGRRRVQQDLMQKGLHAELVNRTLDSAYENIDEAELARRHLERKRVPQPTNDKEAARVMRMLMRGGFSTTAIYKVLKQWKVNDAALAALDSLDDDPSAG